MANPSTQNNQIASRGRMPNARPNGWTSRGAQRQPVTGQQAAEDHVYRIVSVLYHALQGSQAYEKYANDARQAGDSKLEQFFNLCRTEEQSRAQKAKILLADRLEAHNEDESMSSDEAEEDTDADGAR